jgi:hypothetical protein
MMPPMSSLLTDSGLSLPIAFQLTRPLIRAAFQASENYSQVPEHLKQWHPSSPQIEAVMKTHLPESVWTTVSTELVTLFWSLSLYDLSAPVKRYEAELKRLKDRYSELDAKVIITGSSDADKQSRQRKTEMTKLLAEIKDLTEEFEAHRKHCDSIKALLESKKESFIAQGSDGRSNSTVLWGAVVTNLLQYCVLDRIVMSPSDAIYSIQFFFLLHQVETPGFSTIVFIHQFMQTVTPLIFCSTEAEASFLGYAFSSIFRKVNGWYNNKVAFQQENQKCGFLTMVAGDDNAAKSSKGVALSADNTVSDVDVHGLKDSGTGDGDRGVKKNYITFDKFQMVCSVSYSSQPVVIVDSALMVVLNDFGADLLEESERGSNQRFRVQGIYVHQICPDPVI